MVFYRYETLEGEISLTDLLSALEIENRVRLSIAGDEAVSVMEADKLVISASGVVRILFADGIEAVIEIVKGGEYAFTTTKETLAVSAVLAALGLEEALPLGAVSSDEAALAIEEKEADWLLTLGGITQDPEAAPKLTVQFADGFAVVRIIREAPPEVRIDPQAVTASAIADAEKAIALVKQAEQAAKEKTLAEQNLSRTNTLQANSLGANALKMNALAAPLESSDSGAETEEAPPAVYTETGYAALDISVDAESLYDGDAVYTVPVTLAEPITLVNRTNAVVKDDTAIIQVYHIVTVQNIDGTEEDQAVPVTVLSSQIEDGKLLSFTIETDGFSPYVVQYTVDFYYNEFEYHLDGGGAIALSELFALLGIDMDVADVTNVTFSNPELLAVEQNEDGSDWTLTSLQSFATIESLTIEFINGDQIIVRVEDPTAYCARYNTNDVNGGIIFGGDHQYYTEFRSVYALTEERLVQYYGQASKSGDYKKTANENWHFVMWVEDGINFYSNLSQIRPTDPGHEKTFTACFAPNGQYFILYTWDDTYGEVKAGDARYFEYIYPVAPYETIVPQYFNYSADESGMIATPKDGYFFKGWYNYDNDELICTDFTFNGALAASDMIVYPKFEPIYSYRVRVNDPSMAYLTQSGQNAFSGEETDKVCTNARRAQIGGYCSIYNDTFPHARTSDPNKTYSFHYWVKDDGSYPDVLRSDGSNRLRGSGGHNDKNLLDRNNITFVAFYAEVGEHIVRLNYAQPAGSGNTDMITGSSLTYPRTVNTGNGTLYYLYTNDNSGIIVSQNDEQSSKYLFKGWYNEDGRCISTETTFMINSTTVKEDLVLTPVFEEIEQPRNYFIVCYDGSNGLSGGDAPNNTLYSRKESTGRIQGSTAQFQDVLKSYSGETAYASITLPTAAVEPQSVGANHFALQGWYDVYTGNYYRPGETVTIYDDSVFYADWFPDNYSFASSANSIASVDTRNFITTTLYDFNNLFNLDSIELDRDRSYIQKVETTGQSPEYLNYEYWKMKETGSRDFLFISTVSGFGRTLNPAGRTSPNQNHEESTSDAEFAGTVTPGLYDSSPFHHGSVLGMRSLGSANYLYQFDANTGYYYYDSDKNAASFN